MSGPSSNSTKKKSATPFQENALSTVTGRDYTPEKTLATIRAKLFLAGGQSLHIANDGVFYVATPFGQVMRFDSLASLQARADRGVR